jgi:hypothetical protein
MRSTFRPRPGRRLGYDAHLLFALPDPQLLRRRNKAGDRVGPVEGDNTRIGAFFYSGFTQ